MRHLYLHGFASSPASRKAQLFQAAFAQAGLILELPALDQGDFSRLTISGQLAQITQLLDGDSATITGSSMGGYLAALYASLHPEVTRLVLLAPAFGFAHRWTEITGIEKVSRWRQTGWMDVYHYGAGENRPIHYELLADAHRHPGNPDFHQPALVFHGTSDTVVPIDLSRSFAADHPNVELIELRSDHELTDVAGEILTQSMHFLLAARSPTGTLTPDAR